MMERLLIIVMIFYILLVLLESLEEQHHYTIHTKKLVCDDTRYNNKKSSVKQAKHTKHTKHTKHEETGEKDKFPHIHATPLLSSRRRDTPIHRHVNKIVHEYELERTMDKQPLDIENNRQRHVDALKIALSSDLKPDRNMRKY